MKKDYVGEAMRVSVVTVVGNLLLSLLKLLAGIIAHSGAMISDAVHSASDVFSTFIVMIGVRISERSADTEHPYGHERLECVASILLSVMLAAVGVWIGYGGVRTIMSRESVPLQIPGSLALGAAVVSIIVKEVMYRYTESAAKRINSSALLADAWHHRSDAISSIGALIGIAGAKLGFPILDPIASLVICLFIFKASIDIFKEAVGKMIDQACDAQTEEAIRETVLSVPEVMAIDNLKTRLFGPRMYVDVEIAVDGNMPLIEAHRIAERVHDRIEARFPEVKHCMVHENPASEALIHKS